MERIVEEQRERDMMEEKKLLEVTENLYEVKKEIENGNVLEFDFFPLDIKFNKTNLEDFIPGELNRIDEGGNQVGNMSRAEMSVHQQTKLESQAEEVMEEQAPSDNSDDVEVHGLGREKDGLRLKFFIKFWNNWLNVEKKSINWNQVPVGDHWHMFAQEQEGKKWIQSEDVYNRLSDVGKMIKDIFPNGEIIGNPKIHDIPGLDPNPIYGEFTIFTLGLLPHPEQPVVLFSNKTKGSPRWPNLALLYNNIVDLIVPIVRNAERMEISQMNFFKERGYNFEKCEMYPFNSQSSALMEKKPERTVHAGMFHGQTMPLADVYH